MRPKRVTEINAMRVLSKLELFDKIVREFFHGLSAAIDIVTPSNDKVVIQCVAVLTDHILC